MKNTFYYCMSSLLLLLLFGFQAEAQTVRNYIDGTAAKIELDGISNAIKRIEFSEGGDPKAFINWGGSFLTLQNDESSNADIVLDANDDIIFETGTSGLTRMFIDQNGDVGIGTVTPDSKLDINGDLSLTDGNGRIDFKDGSTIEAFINWSGTELSIENTVSPGTGIVTGNVSLGAAGNVVLDADRNIEFRTDSPSSVVMRIDNDGEVGIGTNLSPANLFHIRQRNNADNAILMENDGSGNDYWAFEIGGNDLLLKYDSDGSGSGAFITHGAFDEGTLGQYINSDKKLKNSVQPIYENALEKINQLRPVSYYYNHDKVKEKRAFGFIAQEVEEVLPEFILYPEPGEEDRHLMINYDDFTPLAIRGIQELDQHVEEQTKRMEELEAENEALRNELVEIKALLHQVIAREEIKLEDRTLAPTNDNPQLTQNAPNPFEGKTTITYYIPINVTQASLRISNQNGQIIKDIVINEIGNGQLTLDAQELANGIYFYSLVLDGHLFQTKQMLLNQ